MRTSATTAARASRVRADRGTWIDCSVSLHPGTVRWPDDPPMQIAPVRQMARGDTCNVAMLSLGSHTGTHIDAPAHFFRRGRGVDTMPLDATLGEARVIAIHDATLVTVEELARHRPRRGERLLFKTKNSTRRWPSRPFFTDFVYFSTDAARLLVTRGVRTVGVDYLSVGGYKKNGTDVHRLLLGAGIWIIEGLDLSQARPGTYELLCLPLKIWRGDGAPARVVLRPIVKRRL